jgi:hypothetical protein
MDVPEITRLLVDKAKRQELDRLYHWTKIAWGTAGLIFTLGVAFAFLGVWVSGKFGASAAVLVIPAAANVAWLCYLYDTASQTTRTTDKIQRRIEWEIEHPGRPYYGELDY